MKKRGEVNLWFLVEFIAAFLVGYMLVDVGIAYAKETVYEKAHIAKNLAMEINALSSIPRFHPFSPKVLDFLRDTIFTKF